MNSASRNDMISRLVTKLSARTHLRIITWFLLASVLGGFSSLQAQQNGRIEGTITDKETGETLPGVNVIIKGTTFGAATNIDGEYTIPNIRPGSYTVRISYVGYETTLLTGIDVEAGETTDLDVEIAPQVLSGEGEVVVIGEKPIFDVEKSSTSSTVSRQDIEAAPIREVKDLVGQQAGVIQDPTGLYIKGGRANETGYVIDGVSAKDPLAGTGFGLDLGTNAFENVEVITGGVGAKYGDVTSGVVNVKTQEGGESYTGFFSHKRDNFGDKTSRESNFFNDIYEFNLGGPSVLFEELLPGIGLDVPGNLSFFVSGQISMTDEYTRIAADQVESSLVDDTFWSPRQDNRWNGLAKLTWRVKPGMKIQAAYQRSLTINQNTRMLRCPG